MYLPAQFEEKRIDVLHALIRSHPLGACVTIDGTELVANHIPFLLVADAGPCGTLRGHVARANPVWKQLEQQGGEALIIFQGPEAYITPSWYPSKHADGKAVPTWDYAVVHAHGRPRVIHEGAWLLEHVTQLTRAQESGHAIPWEVSDAPPDYIDKMLGAIVGLEIPVDRLHGKWKVSQNRKMPDRLGVAAGLQSRQADEAHAMAHLVMERARE